LIVWLDQPLVPDVGRFQRVFEFRERSSGELFGDQLAIHVLQIRDWKNVPPTSPPPTALQQWARFLSVESAEQLSVLAMEDQTMARAAQSLEQLSDDPKAARLAQEREDSAMFYRMGLAMSRREGLEKGRQEGLEEGLQKGLEEGLQKGLEEGRLGIQRAILRVCQALGVEVTPSRQESLQTASNQRLQEWLDAICTRRAWPNE
jgi:flagellar biosynthesis/type III secretory pathway protein FliH